MVLGLRCLEGGGMTTNPLLDRPVTPIVTDVEPAQPSTTFMSLRRDRVADLVRVCALAVVIVWHSTLSLFHRSSTGVLTMPNPIGLYSGMWLTTWALQVMPLFFVVSGAVNADAWDRHRLRGGSARGFVWHRVNRFGGPLAVLAMVSATLEAAARLTGYGPFLGRHLVILVPLWTLALLVAYAPLTPLLQWGWERFGFSFTIGLVGAVVLSDLFRFRAHESVAGAVSTFGVWLIAYQLGWVYRQIVRRGSHACVEIGRSLMMLGLFGLVVTTNIGLYPRSMVATSTDAMSNLLPTTVPIVALALFQCGVLLMLRPRLATWLSGERVWNRVERAGGYALPAYLLHMIVVVAMVVVAEGLGVTFSAQLSTMWWLTRPLWLATVAVLLVPLLRVARRFFN